MLAHYVRNSKRIPYGVLISNVDDNGNLIFGYSLCSKKDKFSKSNGLTIAKLRLHENSLLIDCGDQKIIIPTSLINDFKLFVNRSKKYFHVSTVHGNYCKCVYENILE